jgi:hypothetical protein
MNTSIFCYPTLPADSDDVLATLPGPGPGSALRVSLEPGASHGHGGSESGEGFVRLEHLAYSSGAGWYVQKSFRIPRELLAALVPQLRKADCLTPRRTRTAG